MIKDPLLYCVKVEIIPTNHAPSARKNVRTKPPMFPKDFIPEGRIFVGDAVVVPNLLGHAEQSVLTIFSKEHYLRLRDFASRMLLDAFNGGVEYLKRLGG